MAAVPDEVLLKVFSFLSVRDLIDSVRPTCARWSALSYDRSLWRVTHLTSNNAPSCSLKSIMHQLTDVVEDLTLENVSHVLPDLILGSKCPNLKALRLRGIDVTGDDFASLISTYPLLEQLIIFNCKTSLSTENNNLLQVKHLHRLRHLEIIPCFGPDITLENEVFANMPDLVSLKLAGVYLSDDAIGVLLNTALNLKTLVLDNSYMRSNSIFQELNSDYTALETVVLVQSDVDDNRLIQIAEHSPKLRSLSLNGCSNITEKGVIIVTDVCKQLESLCVSTYEDSVFSAEGWRRIVDNCPQLRNLQILNNPEIGDDIICHLAEYCPKLENLFLNECHITDESIDAISLFSAQLHVLDISNCKQVTGAAISKVVVNCKRLTSLCLHRCSGIRDLNFNEFYEKLNAFGRKYDILSEIFRHQEMNDKINGTMRDQDVGATQHANLAWSSHGSQNVHDADLETVPVHSHLSVLDLSFTNITHSSLDQVALHCPDLENLSIKSCSIVTEEAIQAVVKRCRLLKELEVSWKHDLIRTTLSDSTLQAIACFSTKLVHLTINFNSLITSKGIQEVIEKCKSLESFSFETGPWNAVSNNDVFDITASITDRCVECKVHSEIDIDDDGEFSERNIMLILLHPKS